MPPAGPEAAMFWPDLTHAPVRATMLPEQALRLPEGPEWEYEYTWNGERALILKEDARVRITSSQYGRDLTNRFPVVAASIGRLPGTRIILEGVIRSIEPRQWAAFGNAPTETPEGAVIRLIALDLLWLDEIDARQLPLAERRERLKAVVAGSNLLISLPLAGTAGEVLAQACEFGADGVMAKRSASRYRPFARSGDWLRVPLEARAPEPEIPARSLPWPGAEGFFGHGLAFRRMA